MKNVSTKASHAAVLKIKKASFQQGKKTIKSIEHGKAGPTDEYMPGGYIVGNQCIDLTLEVLIGYTIKTETYINEKGHTTVRLYTEKVGV